MSRRACFSFLWFAAAVLHLGILLLWPMTMRAASAEEMQAAGTAELSYEDTYLFESDEIGAERDYPAEAAEESGRRYVSTEVVYYGSETDGFGNTTEQGVRVRWGQETLRFGTLEAEFTVSNLEQDFFNSPRDVTEATISLRQIGVPIVDGYEMNNALGYQRLRSDAYVAGGYRVRLPNSPLLGFSGEIAGFDRSARIFAGRTGEIDGVAFNQFRRDGGDVWGVAYEQDLDDRATIAAQMVSFDGNDLVNKHSSLLTSASFAYPEFEAQYDVSLLADDDGNLGFWADAEQLIGNDILARYGAFYLGPDLAWMDTPIANDQVGLYARADKQSYGLTLSGGYDFLRNGFGSTSRARTSTHNVYFNGSFQFSRALTLGIPARS